MASFSISKQQVLYCLQPQNSSAPTIKILDTVEPVKKEPGKFVYTAG